MRSRIGHYEIVDEVGRGGMGVVYKAHDTALERHVAIKCLAESLASDTTLVARFIREAKSIAKVNHPGIVQVHAADAEEGRPFFVMEFVDGESLEQRLQREGRLPIEEVVRIWIAAGSALHAAHEAGITHRDVKPSNILLDSAGRVKLTDFGIARVEGMGSQLTTTGNFLGTPGYFSPEVCQAREADRRSDIFSLGVVVYESLAGQLPFSGDSPWKMMNEVVAARYPDIQALNELVDADLRQVLDRMLAREPEARYQTCDEMIADLRNVRPETDRQQAAGPETKRETIIAQATPPSGSRSTPGNTTSKTVVGGPITQRRRAIRRYGWHVAVGSVVFAAAVGASYISETPTPEPHVETDEPTSSDDEGSEEKSASIADTASAPQGNVAPIADQPTGQDGPSAVELLGKLRSSDADDSVGEEPRASDTDDSTSEEPRTSDTDDSAGEESRASDTDDSADKGQPGGDKGDSAPDPEPSPAKDEPGNQIVVMAAGSPMLAGPVESSIEAALRHDGHELVEEKFISGVQKHVQGYAVELAGLSELLRSRGADVLVLARLIPVGERELHYSGRSKTAYTTQVNVKTYDLTKQTTLGSGWQHQVTFTDINATEKARQSVDDHVGQLKTVLASR